MIGSSLMIRPVMDQGATSVSVVFPGKDELLYDVKAMRVFEGNQKHTFTDINMATVPVFQRGGHIVPYKFRLRRSTKQMRDDPFTLLVTLNKKETAEGQLYFDDGDSFDYRNKSSFVHRKFEFANGVLKSTNLNEQAPNGFETRSWIERVIIYGFSTQPKQVKIETLLPTKQSTKLQFTYDAPNKCVLVRKPDVNSNKDWSLVIE